MTETRVRETVIGDGSVAVTSSSSGPGVNAAAQAKAAEPSAVTADTFNTLITDLHRQLVTADFEWASRSARVTEQDPISTHHDKSTLADITNGADGIYSYYVDMDGYRKAGFQMELSGGSGTVTVTFEGTLQDDGTAQASCIYHDITSDTWGSATFTASDMLIDNSEKLAVFKFVRVKVVAATGAADDADWTIYFKQLY